MFVGKIVSFYVGGFFMCVVFCVWVVVVVVCVGMFDEIDKNLLILWILV